MSGTNITRDEAGVRSSVVGAAHYEVELDLSTREETFSSKTTVRFNATAGSSTWIDFIAPLVSSITLNGSAVETKNHDGHRIYLDNLAETNLLEVDARAAYMLSLIHI